MPHFIPLSISCSDNPNSTFVFEVGYIMSATLLIEEEYVLNEYA